jgi:ABC-type glycerol-3-phosphate transport system permease component
MLVPMLWLVLCAGHMDWGEANPWQNVVTVWSGGFGDAFVTSALIGAVVAGATIVLALPAAFALHQARSRVLQAVGMMLLAVGLFQPIEVLIIPLFTLLETLGLLNTTAGVMLPEIGRALPLATLLLWASFRAVPRSVLEAASVDGAVPWQVLWRVATPLAAPMVAVTAVWAFLSSWNEYLLPTVVLQDDSLQTVPIALGHFIGRIDTQYALIATGALLAAAPLLVAYGVGYGVLSAGMRRLRVV